MTLHYVQDCKIVLELGYFQGFVVVFELNHVQDYEVVLGVILTAAATIFFFSLDNLCFTVQLRLWYSFP